MLGELRTLQPGGEPDTWRYFYPFVMPRAVVKKRHFVNLVVAGARSW
jgi:hypothetical protein